jgi:hypothetical protein
VPLKHPDNPKKAVERGDDGELEADESAKNVSSPEIVLEEGYRKLSEKTNCQDGSRLEGGVRRVIARPLVAFCN